MPRLVAGLMLAAASLTAIPVRAEVISLLCMPKACGVLGTEAPSCDVGSRKAFPVTFDAQAHPDRLVVIDERRIEITPNIFNPTFPMVLLTKKVILQIDRETGEFVELKKMDEKSDYRIYQKGDCMKSEGSDWKF